MSRKLAACLTLWLALSAGMHGEAIAQADITDKVRRSTPLPQTIRDFCVTYCQGNMREGQLRSVTIRPIGGGRYRGVMTADLRNRQEMDEPVSFTVFDWTIRVRTEGTLDAATCTVVIDSVTVENDPVGLLDGLLDDPKGRKVRIADCKRLLP